MTVASFGDLASQIVSARRPAVAKYRMRSAQALEGRERSTGNLVRRHTKVLVGEEGAFWAPRLVRRHTGRIMQLATSYDLMGRLRHRRDRSRKRNGPLGHVALDVLREMFRIMDWRTGQLDPCYATLAERTGHHEDAVFDAVKRLIAAGFLDKLRRYRPTGRQGFRGPQVEQASNAYQIRIPQALAAQVAGAPTPVDDLDRRRAETEAVERMIACLPLDEQAGVLVDDPGLTRAFAALGRALAQAERGSDRTGESMLK